MKCGKCIILPTEQDIDVSFSGDGDQISQNALDVKVGDKRGNVECNGV